MVRVSLVSVCFLFACVGDSTPILPPDAGMDASLMDVVTMADVSAGCEAGAMTCGGACTPVQSDPMNCGRCMHDCGPMGMCTAGVCQPVQVTTATGAVWLSTDLYPDNPSGLATHVFWIVPGVSSGGMFQDNVGGGNKIQLSSTSTTENGTFAVSGGNVYWPWLFAGNGALTIYKAAIGSVMMPTTADPSSTAFAGTIQGVVIDPTTGYLFGGYGTGSGTGYGVYKCKLDNSQCASVWSTTGAASMNVATDGTNVYIADKNSGNITSILISSGATTPIINSQATPNILRVQGTFLYWSNSGTMAIMRAPIPGSSPMQVASTNAPAAGLAADNVNVYWTDPSTGTVNYAPVGGGGSTTAYVTQGMTSKPMSLVRDGKSLFWLHEDTIWRVALP